MPRFRLVLLTLALTYGWASAQNAPAPAASAPAPAASAPAPASNTDSAKLEDFRRRFAEGKILEDQGKFTEALAVFDAIIAESPDAKGSLREAGLVCLKLKDPTRAAVYFEKLRSLVPEYPAAIESLIQVREALHQNDEAERLVAKFHELYAQGKVPNPYFVREVLPFSSGQTTAITEYFNPGETPHIVWKLQVLHPDGQVMRQLALIYDPGATPELRAKNPRLANSEQYLLVEDILDNGSISRIDAYFQTFSRPGYERTRDVMFSILAGKYNPIYSRQTKASATVK